MKAIIACLLYVVIQVESNEYYNVTYEPVQRQLLDFKKHHPVSKSVLSYLILIANCPTSLEVFLYFRVIVDNTTSSGYCFLILSSKLFLSFQNTFICLLSKKLTVTSLA